MGRLTLVVQGLAWLVVAGLVVEFYLAGAALFGVVPSFQLHRAVGSILVIGIVLLLVLSVIARSGRRLLGMTTLLAGLTVLQAALPSLRAAVPAFAALHVLNAALLLGLAGPIARMAGQHAERAAPEERAMAAART